MEYLDNILVEYYTWCYVGDPYNLILDVLSDTEIDLSWSNYSASYTFIYIERSTDGSNFVVIDAIGGSETTYSDTGLTTNTQYYYRIRAFQSGEYTDYSNIATATTFYGFLLTSRGTGIGVAYFSIKVSSEITLTLDDTARFYSNSAGTIGESTTWICTPGALRTRYIRCPSDTAHLWFSDKDKVIGFGHSVSLYSGNWGWDYSGIEANVPSINLSNWDLPNCIDIAFTYPNLVNFSITLSDLSISLERITLSSGGTLTGTLADIGNSCIIFSIIQANTIGGNVSALSNALVYFGLTGTNTITGDVDDLSDAITYLVIAGNNTLSGDIGDFPISLYYTEISGNNTLSGNITNLPVTLTRFSLTGLNTITGDIADIPALITYFYVAGNETLNGDIADIPVVITIFFAAGSNTISGNIADIPVTITYLYIGGNNTISGDVADIPANVGTFSIYGNNTISGTVASIPNTIGTLKLYGLNIINGDLGDLNDIIIFNLGGHNTVSDYTGKAWAQAGYEFIFIPFGVGGLSSAEVDQLLIDIDACAFTSSYKIVTLTGTNGAPTGASAAARASLIAKGVTLTTN